MPGSGRVVPLGHPIRDGGTLLKLKDRTAIVTGGGGAFGRGIALALASEGADVVLADMKMEAAASVAREVESLGRRALPLEVDVSREDQVSEMAGKTLEAFGKIDILVNNAGISGARPIQELSLEEWNRTIGVNLTGTFLCCRAVVDPMIAREYGKIVNISSVSGLTGRLVNVAYSASKTGILGITRTLALQVARHGINVNAVAPGPIVTPLLEKDFPPEISDRLRATIPYKRQGRPGDVASAVLFLVSEESEWVTGEVLNLSGGAFMG
jgi:NAD(P)-dependent dehydrogenase (short-subunit alcohol dehydrogenase family)